MLLYLIYRLIILIFNIRSKRGLSELNGIHPSYISLKCTLLLTGSHYRTLSNDCAFLTYITMLPLIRSQFCTASNMTHMLPSKDVTSYRWPILYRIRHASAMRNAVHTSWLLGVASRARLQLLFILLALRLNYTLNLISISQQVRLTVADKRTLARQADKSTRHPGGEKYQLRVLKEYRVESIFVYLFRFWTLVCDEVWERRNIWKCSKEYSIFYGRGKYISVSPREG